METTLEVRWFIKGMPPASVQRWFRLECPGKFISRSKVRKDWYAALQPESKFTLKNILTHELNLQEVNLKFRQGNLELKLKNQELGTHQFGQTSNLRACDGKVEQWCKYSYFKIDDFVSVKNSVLDTYWIGVDKEREQKTEWGVSSELTWLKIDREPWWTIAFEMNQSDRLRERSDSYFKKVVARACRTYHGPKLSARNSFGYSRWLLELTPSTTPYSDLW